MLGGNRKMLRAKNLASLINHQTLPSDRDVAATVTLRLTARDKETADECHFAVQKTLKLSGSSAMRVMRSQGGPWLAMNQVRRTAPVVSLLATGGQLFKARESFWSDNGFLEHDSINEVILWNYDQHSLVSGHRFA